MVDVLDSNLKEINSLIPWSGRMLSVVDLIERGTLSLRLGAYLVNVIRTGASVLIGARPGGVGKTTMMGALLGLIPASDRIITVESASMVKRLRPGTQKNPKSYVIREISDHGPMYLWGPPVVAATRLVGPYTRLASNLHADSIAGVRAAFRRCGSEEAMNVFDLIIFIRYLRRGGSRVVSEVWEFDGSSQSFCVVYSEVEGFSQPLARSSKYQKWERFLSRCIDHHIGTMEDVAHALRKYTK